MRSLYSGILNIEDETLQNEACRIVIRVTKQKIEMETLILIVEIYIGLHKNVQNLLQFLRSRIESGKMNKHIIHELSLENLFQKFDRRIALTKAFTMHCAIDPRKNRGGPARGGSRRANYGG